MCTVRYWDRPNQEVNLSGACVERRNNPVVRSSPLGKVFFLLSLERLVVCAWGGVTARLSGAPRVGSSFVDFWLFFRCLLVRLCRFLPPRQTFYPEKDSLSSCGIGRFAAKNRAGAGKANFAGVCVERRRSPALRSSPMYYSLWFFFRRLLAHVLKRTNCSLSSGTLCDEAQVVHLGEVAQLFHVCAEKRRNPLRSFALLPAYSRT